MVDGRPTVTAAPAAQTASTRGTSPLQITTQSSESITQTIDTGWSLTVYAWFDTNSHRIKITDAAIAEFAARLDELADADAVYVEAFLRTTFWMRSEGKGGEADILAIAWMGEDESVALYSHVKLVSSQRRSSRYGSPQKPVSCYGQAPSSVSHTYRLVITQKHFARHSVGHPSEKTHSHLKTRTGLAKKG